MNNTSFQKWSFRKVTALAGDVPGADDKNETPFLRFECWNLEEAMAADADSTRKQHSAV